MLILHKYNLLTYQQMEENMEKLLQNEYEELYFNKEEEFKEKLKFISDNLRFITTKVSDSKIIVIDKKEAKTGVAGQMSLTETGEVVDSLETIAPVSDYDGIQQCYSNSRRLAILPNEKGSITLYPTYHTAQNGILDRRNCNCGAITGCAATLRPDSNTEEFFINSSAERTKSSEQWGILDGAVIANASESYVPLDCALGFKEFETTVRTKWPEATFSNGQISYEFYKADFNINDDLAVDSIKQTLIDLGIRVQNLRVFARFMTSDTTNAMMSANILLEINGVLTSFSKKLGVAHIGKNVSIAEFSEQIKDLGTLLEESEDKIEELGDLNLEEPAGALANALKKVGLYNKVGKEAVDLLVVNKITKFTALEAIIKCNEVLGTIAKNEVWSAGKILDYSEKVSRLINARWSELDKPLQ